MSSLPILIILLSACIHATWNFLAKLSNGGFVFVWIYMGISMLVYFPFVLYVMIQNNIILSVGELLFIAGTSIIHTLYAVLLQKGYKVGDFSVIYPIARGTAPVIVAISAAFLFNEKVSIALFIGIAFIILSIFILTGGIRTFRQSSALIGVMYGVLVGLFIASYTLIDKGAMSVLFMHPLVFYYGCIIGQFVLLTPYTLLQKKKITFEWKLNKKYAIGVGILNPLSYMLVLVVMIYQPVSQIAPLREMSIIIGVILGAVLLKEGFGRQRFIAACCMVIGVMAIALFN